MRHGGGWFNSEAPIMSRNEHDRKPFSSFGSKKFSEKGFRNLEGRIKGVQLDCKDGSRLFDCSSVGLAAPYIYP